MEEREFALLIIELFSRDALFSTTGKATYAQLVETGPYVGMSAEDSKKGILFCYQNNWLQFDGSTRTFSPTEVGWAAEPLGDSGGAGAYIPWPLPISDPTGSRDPRGRDIDDPEWNPYPPDLPPDDIDPFADDKKDDDGPRNDEDDDPHGGGGFGGSDAYDRG